MIDKIEFGVWNIYLFDQAEVNSGVSRRVYGGCYGWWYGV